MRYDMQALDSAMQIIGIARTIIATTSRRAGTWARI
jgi:hypothetical protein